MAIRIACQRVRGSIVTWNKSLRSQAHEVVVAAPEKQGRKMHVIHGKAIAGYRDQQCIGPKLFLGREPTQEWRLADNDSAR